MNCQTTMLQCYGRMASDKTAERVLHLARTPRSDARKTGPLMNLLFQHVTYSVIHILFVDPHLFDICTLLLVHQVVVLLGTSKFALVPSGRRNAAKFVEPKEWEANTAGGERWCIQDPIPLAP